jgi:thiamine biosynthesis lipoprotein ApbE
VNLPFWTVTKPWAVAVGDGAAVGMGTVGVGAQLESTRLRIKSRKRGRRFMLVPYGATVLKVKRQKRVKREIRDKRKEKRDKTKARAEELSALTRRRGLLVEAEFAELFKSSKEPNHEGRRNDTKEIKASKSQVGP